MLVVEYLVCSLSARFVCVEIYDGVIVVQFCVDCWGASCLFPNLSLKLVGTVSCMAGRTSCNVCLSSFLIFYKNVLGWWKCVVFVVDFLFLSPTFVLLLT